MKKTQPQFKPGSSQMVLPLSHWRNVCCQLLYWGCDDSCKVAARYVTPGLLGLQQEVLQYLPYMQRKPTKKSRLWIEHCQLIYTVSPLPQCQSSRESLQREDRTLSIYYIPSLLCPNARAPVAQQ